MKPALLLAAVMLASCAPALVQGVEGRIVNVRTGQEGRITFLDGFRSRASSTAGPDNVTIMLGDTLYSGRYTVLGYGGPHLGNLSLNFGNSFTNGQTDSIFGDGGYYGTFGPFPTGQNFTRPGNLIARATQGGASSTLTCTFQTDNSLHGIGNCQDSAGGSYSLQF